MLGFLTSHIQITDGLLVDKNRQKMRISNSFLSKNKISLCTAIFWSKTSRIFKQLPLLVSLSAHSASSLFLHAVSMSNIRRDKQCAFTHYEKVASVTNRDYSEKFVY